MNEILLSDSEKEILEWMWKEDKEYSYRDIAAQFGEDSERGGKTDIIHIFNADGTKGRHICSV